MAVVDRQQESAGLLLQSVPGGGGPFQRTSENLSRVNSHLRACALPTRWQLQLVGPGAADSPHRISPTSYCGRRTGGGAGRPPLLNRLGGDRSPAGRPPTTTRAACALVPPPKTHTARVAAAPAPAATRRATCVRVRRCWWGNTPVGRRRPPPSQIKRHAHFGAPGRRRPIKLS
jgi:hypothetical protein